MNPVDPAPAGAPPAVDAPSVVRVRASIDDRALESLLAVGSRGFESFRLLRAKVATIAETRPFGAFGVVGAAPGEGASTTAIGLACAIAREGEQRVLLAETDLHRPGLERRLGLTPLRGLAEHLADDARQPVLRRVHPFDFTLLAAGEPSATSAERLRSPAFARLLSSLRAHFDVIVCDCPPITPAADAIGLQDQLDGLLLVVRSRHTPRDIVRRAFSHLKRDRVAGVVFNDHRGVMEELPLRWWRGSRG